MVSVYWPTGAVLPAVTVSVLLSGCRVRRKGCGHAAGQAGHGKIHVAGESVLWIHIDVGGSGGPLARHSSRNWRAVKVGA